MAHAAFGCTPNLRRYRSLVLTATLLTFLLITMGGVVCVTGSGKGCPDWPRCYGRFIPPMRVDAIIEYLHRLIAALTSPFTIAAAIMGLWRHRSDRWLSRPPALAVGFLALVVFFGAMAVLRGLPPVLAAVDLGSALLVLALMLAATLVAFYRCADPAGPTRFSLRGPFTRLTVWTSGTVFVVLAGGKLVAENSSAARCLGWPLWSGFAAPGDLQAWLRVVHLLIAGAASILVVVTVVQAWRTQRARTVILSSATLAGILFLVLMLIGALLEPRGFPVFLLALRVVSSAGLWVALAVLTLSSGLVPAAPAGDGPAGPRRRISSGPRIRDFLVMTRPVVVVLLMASTYTGMVMGARILPSLLLTLWTLLGVALAAGGAQAINAYLDRDIDCLLSRTARRPLPAGRLTPAEGLAWGLGLSVASLYILAVFVNGLAAAVSMAGILWYVVLYTQVLKRRSAASTVVGGVAGALLPIVGWVAVRGGLNLAALWLFAIVFLWSPPHFWALSLVHLQDYARAGLPVFPVVHGEGRTRDRLVLYTAALVGMTLLLPVLHAAGGIFLVSALVLGGIMLIVTWRSWKQGGRRLDWSLYRLSSLYLAFLFLALVVDTLA